MSDAAAKPQDIAEAFAGIIEGAAELPPSLTIPIDPIPHAGTDYTEITVREPTQKQRMQAAEKLRTNFGPEAGEANYWTWMIHLTSGVPHEVISRVGVSRINIARRYIELFLDYGLQIGPN